MPRAGLTPLRVVEEAEGVADEVGLANLTLAAVALRLGVRLPSLYKHTAGMEALQRDVAVRARWELAGVLSRAVEGHEREAAVVALAEAFRSWGHRHPGRYAATVRAPDPEDVENVGASAGLTDVIDSVFADFGLEGETAIHAVRALRAAMHGFITLEQAGGFGLPVDVDLSYRQLIAGLASSFGNWPPSHDPRQ